jgi:hypothetical protein|tara:strand:+ start:1044 stop:1349 length:306 start_codon:yes stop_codon:yes gene_type:complete
MSSQIHAGDVGTKLIVTVKDDGSVVDISSASSLSIFIKKPDGTILTRSGTLETDGTDGKMHYIVVSGDLDVAGVYKIQGKVVLSSGTFSTTTATFKVQCNL